jgi:PAS domain S-box-containing protein
MYNGLSGTLTLPECSGQLTEAPKFQQPMIWIFGPDGELRSASKAWLVFRGVTIEQERGIGWTDGLHPDDRLPCLDLFRTAFTSRTPFQARFRIRCADHSYAWVQGHGVPVYLNNGKFLGYSGELKEIQVPASNRSGRHGQENTVIGPPRLSRTRPKRRRRAVSVKRLQRCLDESAEPLVVLDAYGKVIFCNPAAEPFLTMRLPGKDQSLPFSVSRILGDLPEPSNCDAGAALTRGTRAQIDSNWKIDLCNVRVNIDLLGEGLTALSFDQASARGMQSTQDRVFIHDLLNMANSIQVLVDLLEDERTSSEERREYVSLLNRSLEQLLSEIEERRSLLDGLDSERPRHSASAL